MKVLGFRSDPSTPRYAIVSRQNGVFKLENADSESDFPFPDDMDKDALAKRMEFIYNEVIRVFRENPDIAKVMIKQNEFNLTEKRPMRHSVRYDAVVILACALKNIPVEVETYRSMKGTKAKMTRQHAEERVGKTGKNWTDKMADAVNVAWLGL